MQVVYIVQSSGQNMEKIEKSLVRDDLSMIRSYSKGDR